MPTIVRNTLPKPKEVSAEAERTLEAIKGIGAGILIVAAIVALYLTYRIFCPSWEPTANTPEKRAAGQRLAGKMMKESYDSLRGPGAAKRLSSTGP